jgi:hypothetical protein
MRRRLYSRYCLEKPDILDGEQHARFVPGVDVRWIPASPCVIIAFVPVISTALPRAFGY